MAATNYTPISLYYSTTASAVPTAGNLISGELAINITDGKLYYKNNSGVVTLIAGATAGPAGGSNNQVQYNSSGLLTGSANLTFNGTTLTANTIGAFILSGNITQTGNPSINIGSGALTAGATSVTTLTASAGITNTQASGNSTLVLSGSGAYSSVVTLNGAGGGSGQVTAGASVNLVLNAPTGQSVFGSINNATITTTSSTGLAVTGALSASGSVTMTSGGTSAAQQTIAYAATGGDAALLINNTDTDASSRASLQLKTGTSVNVWQLFARNNSVTLGVSGVADYITFNASGMNGVLGATTPAAASVTTLTATSTATLSAATAISIPKTGGLIEFKNTGGTVRTGYIQEATGNLAIVGEVAGSTVVTYANNSLITTVSSTGLAVTGALTAGATGVTTLTATGNLSTTGSSSILQVLAGASVQIQNAAASANWNLQTSGTGLSINSPQNGTLNISNNTAIDGALSATGDVTVTKSFPALVLQPNAGTYSNIQMRGNATLALGLDILAGAQNAYFSADSLTFRSAASVNYGVFSSTGLGVTGALSATTTIKTGGYTVGTLPAGTVGMRAYVTDATAPTYNGALTGGGAVTVPVFYNGAAWVSA